MGLMDFIKGELIEIIEWTDDSRDTLSYRFPDDDKEIKRGAQLIVRESQVVQFVYLGQFGDLVRARQAHADHRQHPGPDDAQGLEVRVRVAVQGRRLLRHHAAVHRQQVGHVQPGDDARQDFGIVRLRAFGTYDFRVVEPPRFLKEVAGTDQHFRLDEFADVMRSRIVSVFSDALASSKVPALDVATRYSELGDALLPLINPVLTREVRHRDGQLHPRERVGAAGGRSGDRQALEHGGGRQPERLREVPDGAGAREGRQPASAASAPRWPSACRWRSRC